MVKFRGMALATGILAAAVATTCRENPSSTPRRAAGMPSMAAPDRTGEPAAPADTVRHVHALRRAGRLMEMGAYVTVDRRQAVVDIVRAVDQLILDNRALQKRFEDAGRGAVGSLFDRSQVANIIGVFSMDLEVIRERRNGGSAVVTIQVGRRLPLEQVNLELQGDRWMIRPDPPIPGLADELRKLGKALLRVGDAVKREKMTADQIAHEMEFWQRPVMKRINQLIEQAHQDEPTDQGDDPGRP